MVLQCPIVVTVTAPPTPTVTPCATYKSQRGIGANATYQQAAQATLDFQNGVIDKACSEAIVLSYQATIPTATPANITAIATPFLPPATQPYIAGMTVTIGITWKNTGGTSGTYYPRILVNGTELYPPGGGMVQHTLAAGASETVLFNIPIAGAGEFDICPGNN